LAAGYQMHTSQARKSELPLEKQSGKKHSPGKVKYGMCRKVKFGMCRKVEFGMG